MFIRSFSSFDEKRAKGKKLKKKITAFDSELIISYLFFNGTKVYFIQKIKRATQADQYILMLMLLIYVNLINVCCLKVMLWRFLSCYWKKLKFSLLNERKKDACCWDKHKLFHFILSISNASIKFLCCETHAYELNREEHTHCNYNLQIMLECL